MRNWGRLAAMSRSTRDRQDGGVLVGGLALLLANVIDLTEIPSSPAPSGCRLDSAPPPLLTNQLVNFSKCRPPDMARRADRRAAWRRGRRFCRRRSRSSPSRGWRGRAPTPSPPRRASTRRCSTTTSRARAASTRRWWRITSASSIGRRWRCWRRPATPAPILLRYVSLYFDFISARQRYASLYQQLMTARGKPLERLVRKYFVPRSTAFNKLLERGIRDGEFRRTDARHTAISIVGLIVFYFSAAPVLQPARPLRRVQRRQSHAPQAGSARLHPPRPVRRSEGSLGMKRRGPFFSPPLAALAGRPLLQRDPPRRATSC